MSKRTIDDVDSATSYDAKRVEVENEHDDIQPDHSLALPLSTIPSLVALVTAAINNAATVPAPPVPAVTAAPAVVPLPLSPHTTQLLQLPDDCLSLITSQLPVSDRRSLRVTNRAMNVFTDMVYTSEMLEWLQGNGWWVSMDMFLRQAAVEGNKAAMRHAREQGATDFKEALKAAAGSGQITTISLLLEWISESPRVYTAGTVRLYQKMGVGAIKLALRGNFNDCTDAIYSWIQRDWSAWCDANSNNPDLCMLIEHCRIELLQDCVLALDTISCDAETFSQVYLHWYSDAARVRKSDEICKALYQDLFNTMMLIATRRGMVIFVRLSATRGANNYDEAYNACHPDHHGVKYEINEWIAIAKIIEKNQY